MKLRHLLEDTTPIYKIERMRITMSEYSSQADKIVKTLVKTFGQEMKKLKGRWNGYEFEFKKEEFFNIALQKRKEFQEEYESICKRYPPGSTSNGIEDYFKHLKTSGNPMYRK